MTQRRKRKNRAQKELEYKEKYSHIPVDFNERLSWMYDHYHVTESKQREILNARYMMLRELQYTDITIVLFEEPEGTPRPRFRLVNRTNFVNEALSNGQFVHVYSINAKEDSLYMRRLVDEELIQLNNLIYSMYNAI